MFKKHGPLFVTEMQEQLACEDRHQLVESAHRLKGLARQLGLSRLENFAETLQQQAPTIDLTDLHAIVQQIDITILRSIEEMNTFLDTYP
ncbi:Hpt domain-containing protein [Magnetococcales bacterium HHB-1]